MLIASTLPDLSEVITPNVRRDSVHERSVVVEEDEGDFVHSPGSRAYRDATQGGQRFLMLKKVE